ncbi:hypothetical protein MRBLMC3_000126 [Sphingobium sp. LMC3-1-1.1]|uniref:hypothetical protein n=1 Tax=Sphingobium sp. LMC3-1-1.1 TaxID=3135241 RepID=UPI00341EDA10
MKHFWLDDEQQSVMDTATSTAAQYSHVALMRTERAWRNAIKELLGSYVAYEDHKRVTLKRGALKRFPEYPNTFLRLNKQQAMKFRLRFDNGENTRLVADPTGEIWGNLHIAGMERDAGAPNHLRFSHHKGLEAFESFRGAGLPFGPTLATVADHCKGLPMNWARSLVWHKAGQWGDAAIVIEQLPASNEVTYLPECGKIITDLFTYTKDAFSLPVEWQGQKWAREWWVQMQNTAFRDLYKVPNEPDGPIL